MSITYTQTYPGKIQSALRATHTDASSLTDAKSFAGENMYCVYIGVIFHSHAHRCSAAVFSVPIAALVGFFLGYSCVGAHTGGRGVAYIFRKAVASQASFSAARLHTLASIGETKK